MSQSRAIRDDDITIALPLRCELRQMYRYKYEYSLVKNLSTQ